MSLPKASLILTILLNFGLLFLFINYIKLNNSLIFTSRRVDELEKRPAVVSNPFPMAGESGRLTLATITPTPTVLPSPSPTLTPQVAVPTQKPTASEGIKISYLPIYGGGAQTTSNDWVDVLGSDFQLKASDYGGKSYFTFEAIAWTIGGSGQARLRIYDATNNVVVTGSEVSATSSKPSLVSSGRLTFFSGNNTYRVQLSSQTSSNAQFDFGRIKVVY